MGQRQCQKCNEMVDEAKAFCPACGNALVEEETREAESGYEAMDSTVQLGQTMYNQMLSDMGLNISKAPQPEKRVEVLAPEPTPPTAEPPSAKPAKEASPNYLLWIAVAAGALIFLLVVLIIVGAILIYYWPRIS